MAITPRFRRVAALQREFVDRAPLLEAFAGEIDQVRAALTDSTSSPRVFNVTGVGGIGKSRLLRELRVRAPEGWRTASLDLQVPAMRQQEDALAVLRAELGGQGVRFDRFDLAYAVLWQRIHPHLRISRETLPFVEESGILMEIVDSVAGLPVFGTALGLLKAAEKATSDARRRYRIRHDETLSSLDDLPNAEVVDAVTFLFAEDLRAASETRPYVLTIDTYEALVPEPTRSGRTQLADVWLRDLIAQLDRGLVVIAGREPLRWDVYDADWRGLIDTCTIGGLPMEARMALLGSSGIAEEDERLRLAAASAGLPFYLHLAVDTSGSGTEGDATGRRLARAAATQREILQRFLQHVGPDEVRTLEVLGVARIFDLKVFRALTAALQLPGHVTAWESISSYSFVYPAGEQLRFHQLMAEALRDRLSEPARLELHRLLHDTWRQRAFEDPEDGDITSQESSRAVHGRMLADPVAFREMVFHAFPIGEVTGTELLDLVEVAVRGGSESAAGGVLADLREFMRDHPAKATPELTQTAQVLDVEAVLRSGEATKALELTPDEAWNTSTTVGARFAVAAGQARRIAGRTSEALTLYNEVWNGHDDTARMGAGLWAADLHMCQGRFVDAERFATELDTIAARRHPEARGDVARLRHLAHRFAFDFATSGRLLDEAATYYQTARSYLGNANIRTNRAELLAFTDPEAALTEARAAIEVQTEIGAQHELGKCHTAIAVASLRLGRLDHAEAALSDAVEALTRASYRSGLARARLYRAALEVRRGRRDLAQTSVRWAVSELEAAEVYPTLILAAGITLRELGIEDEAVTQACQRAERAIQPLTTLDDVKGRIDVFARDLLGLGEATR
ncbi:aminoglycoside phosphotransferase family protein [Frankia sp. AgB32]|uniref:aminoglycoside phosphotransferase family protein n=1 Tax=Frankia sp. AgB32 TaxID=631119 RepID=UPI00200EC5B6|nr:aminoglycoside phosphotransferase family protein [Frankia sp. AgB32]MCK9893605.1 aminoglycoside phosphotransferase family protein [Frankia sp. AgB32]